MQLFLTIYKSKLYLAPIREHIGTICAARQVGAVSKSEPFKSSLSGRGHGNFLLPKQYAKFNCILQKKAPLKQP